MDIQTKVRAEDLSDAMYRLAGQDGRHFRPTSRETRSMAATIRYDKETEALKAEIEGAESIQVEDLRAASRP